MSDTLLHHWEMLIGRWYGPLSFRLLVQPTVAAILGIRAGLADARAGRAAYGWSVLTHSGNRLRLIRDGWKDVAKLFLVALVLDVVYQIIVLERLYPGHTILIAATLALPSYFIVRGPTNRIARSVLKRRRSAVNSDERSSR